MFVKGILGGGIQWGGSFCKYKNKWTLHWFKKQKAKTWSWIIQKGAGISSSVNPGWIMLICLEINNTVWVIFLWKCDQTSTCDLPRAAATVSLGATSWVRKQELGGSTCYLRQHKAKWAPLTTAERGQHWSEKWASCNYSCVPCVVFRSNKMVLVACQQFTCGVVLEFHWNQIN